jgi:hypothetical protein
MSNCWTVCRRPAHGVERSSWSVLPDSFSRSMSCELWALRRVVAYFQQSLYVCGMEWRQLGTGSSESIVRPR